MQSKVPTAAVFQVGNRFLPHQAKPPDAPLAAFYCASGIYVQHLKTFVASCYRSTMSA